MDIFGLWLEAACDVGPECTTFGADAYCSYKIWAEQSGLRPLGSPGFGRKLKDRFAYKRVAGGYRYIGFRPRGIRPSESMATLPLIKIAKVVPM